MGVHIYMCAMHIDIYVLYLPPPPLWEGVLVLIIRASNCCHPPTQSPCFSPLFSVPRWERHGEALCGARSADEGALHVNQDGLAVTACLAGEVVTMKSSCRAGLHREPLNSSSSTFHQVKRYEETSWSAYN